MKLMKKEILKQLYPGENTLLKYRDFQRKKYRLMMIIVLAGIVAAFCMHLSSRMQSRLAEGTHLYRNEWGEGSYSVTLRAITDSGEESYDYEVKERILTKEELDLLKDQITVLLPEMILGNNESLMAVSRDLNLITGISGCPFSISWQSSDLTKVRTDGKVMTDSLPEDGEEIILTAEFLYEGERWKQEITVKLLPEVFTPKEQFFSNVRDAILENDKLYERSHEVFLPEKIGEEDVVWKEYRKDHSFLLLVLGILGAMSVPYFMDRELEEKRKLRGDELARSYSEFVSKLQLYMGAGLTTKRVFLKTGKDYQAEKGRTGKKKFIYEEILIADYQLLNGKPEDAVYREWGKRCGNMRYRKLGSLLAAYLNQGNDKILSLLSEETDMALEERKNRIRKQGEEAGTKLLLPMMMQLIVVMFLILLPAFSGFGNM